MRSSMSKALIWLTGEESSDMTVAVDLYGGDGVFKVLGRGFGVHGLDLEGLASSIESKYSMLDVLRCYGIEWWASCLDRVGERRM